MQVSPNVSCRENWNASVLLLRKPENVPLLEVTCVPPNMRYELAVIVPLTAPCASIVPSSVAVVEVVLIVSQ